MQNLSFGRKRSQWRISQWVAPGERVDLIQIVTAAVTILITEGVFITHLRVPVFSKGFGIAKAQTIIIVFIGCPTILIEEACGLAVIVLYIRDGIGATVSLAIVIVCTETHIAAFASQATNDIHASTHRIINAAAFREPFATIDGNTGESSCGISSKDAIQRRTAQTIRVALKSSTPALAAVMAVAMRERGADIYISH